jgi:hypothetical protein
VVRKPGVDFAESVLNWLNAGVPTPTVSDYIAAATNPNATYQELRALYEEVARRNWLDAAVLGPDDKSITLKELIMHRGTEAKNRSQQQNDSGQPGGKGKRQAAKDRVVA